MLLLVGLELKENPASPEVKATLVYLDYPVSKEVQAALVTVDDREVLEYQASTDFRARRETVDYQDYQAPQDQRETPAEQEEMEIRAVGVWMAVPVYPGWTVCVAPLEVQVTGVTTASLVSVDSRVLKVDQVALVETACQDFQV